MLVACRLVGLSVLILDYAVKVPRAQFAPKLAWSPQPDLSWAQNSEE